MKQGHFCLVVTAFFLAFFSVACVDYSTYYTLDANYLQRRQTQTKRFETADQGKILIASAQVLQDLGYFITESCSELGLIIASKEKEIPNLHYRALNTVLSVVGFASRKGIDSDPTYDVSQKIKVTIFVQPATIDTAVRVSFSRTITDNKHKTRLEKIDDANIYKEFFEKLSQSVFLTAYSI